MYYIILGFCGSLSTVSSWIAQLKTLYSSDLELGAFYAFR